VGLAFASEDRSYKAADSQQSSSDVFLSGFTPSAFPLKGKLQPGALVCGHQGISTCRWAMHAKRLRDKTPPRPLCFCLKPQGTQFPVDTSRR